MSEHGEWIGEWEADDETQCASCGETDTVHYRLFRMNNGKERYLNKCFACEDSSWVDA